MYKVQFPVDQSVETAVERRQAAEAARKTRIFNTRQRVMGLDLDALHKQTLEKKHSKEMERERDKDFDKLRLKHDQVLLQRDTEERKVREALHAGLTQYWNIQQRVEDSRDAGLKCGLRGVFGITIPAAELGPSSMQTFQGEDIGAAQRKREQMKQTARDLLAQRVQQERSCFEDKHRTSQLINELHERQGLTVCGSLQATEQAERLQESRRREERENLAEKWHTLTSTMMTEGWEAAVSQLQKGKPAATDMWKGISPEQLSAIYREREAQCMERQRWRDTEKNREAAWNSQLLKASGEARQEEKRTAELRRAKRIQADQFNKQLAKEQQAHQQYLDKDLYANKPTQEYFCQFNTTSR
uniref:RIB43A-like with coiled-coils protein 1 n=1 Tax=Hippocampus comes TaxID=109280 RepID=A0A3Q2YKT7_HIPCM